MPKNKSKTFWHPYPADRTFIEKIARRFAFPFYPHHARSLVGWERYRTRMKRSFPIRWFFWETIPDWWYDFVVYPKNGVINFFRYRFKDRFHIVETGLGPGYQDPDHRMLHASFNLLKDYVEIELAASQTSLDESDDSDSGAAFYKKLIKFRRRQKPDPQKGLKYLNWEIAQSYYPATQSDPAKEKKFLYLWWTDFRPKRLDLYGSPLIWSGAAESIWHPSDSQLQYYLINQLEKFYEAEDTEMFQRLVAIRSTLWT